MSNYTADDFRNADNFRTGYDTDAGSKDAYAKGRRIGMQSKSVTIALNDTWSADGKTGGILTSYQRLGYHADTAALLRGLLDSGVMLAVYRDTGRAIVRHNIRELAAA
jgi:hypothetical protein